MFAKAGDGCFVYYVRYAPCAMPSPSLAGRFWLGRCVMGISKNGKARLKAVWKAMNQRCCRENFREYECYGGSGIGVCDAWSDGYANFEKWALENGYDENADRGECTLDRINPFGDYSPENCRWVDMRMQNSNMKIDVIHDASDDFLYFDEVVDMLGEKRSWVEAKVKDGSLPYMKIGKRKLFSKIVVELVGNGTMRTERENKNYHYWTEAEDAIITNPPTFDIAELSVKIGLSESQIRTRLYRLGTTWSKIIETKTLEDQCL